MTNKKYLKRMNALSTDLERAATAQPYDPDAYNVVVNRINALHSAGYRSRRRRPWEAFFFCFSLTIVLAWIVFEIVYALYF